MGAACVATEQDAGVVAPAPHAVLPDGLEGEFYRARKAQESQYLDEIRVRFPRLRRIEVRQLPRDVYGLASLTAIAEQLE